MTSSWPFGEEEVVRIAITNTDSITDWASNCVERDRCYLHYDPTTPCVPVTSTGKGRSLAKVGIPSDCVCGRTKSMEPSSSDPFSSAFNIDLQDRIIGGTESEKHMFPWQCGLVKKKRNFIWCGCTLISDQWVLTARHCTIGEDHRKMQVSDGQETFNHRWHRHFFPSSSSFLCSSSAAAALSSSSSLSLSSSS